MTEKEFLALSDRDRDALVAEKVMGWTHRDVSAEECLRITGDVAANHLWFNAKGWWHYNPVPYTTDDDYALLVVDRMIADDFPFVLHYRQDRKRWQATFDGMRYEAFAPTRALAIALAALRSSGAFEEVTP
jgi:hypothetical protein